MAGSRRPSRGVTALRALIAVGLGAAGAGTLLPDRLGLAGRSPFVEAVAFRPQAAVTAVAASVVLSAWPGAGHREVRRAGVALGALGAAGLAAAAAARTGLRARTPGSPPAGIPPTEVTVLSFNPLHRPGRPRRAEHADRAGRAGLRGAARGRVRTSGTS